MKIKYSRHVKRRMKLYNISEETINDMFQENSKSGKNIIVKDVPGFKYPLKLVYEVGVNFITVITVYPLKRSFK